MPYYREKSLAYRGKSGQNRDNDFLALGLGVVLYLPFFAHMLGTLPPQPTGLCVHLVLYLHMLIHIAFRLCRCSSMVGSVGASCPHQPSQAALIGMTHMTEVSTRLVAVYDGIYCKRLDLLQSPGTPKPQKRILKSDFGPPRKNGPKSRLKYPKSPFLGS